MQTGFKSDQNLVCYSGVNSLKSGLGSVSHQVTCRRVVTMRGRLIWGLYHTAGQSGVMKLLHFNHGSYRPIRSLGLLSIYCTYEPHRGPDSDPDSVSLCGTDEDHYLCVRLNKLQMLHSLSSVCFKLLFNTCFFISSSNHLFFKKPAEQRSSP